MILLSDQLLPRPLMKWWIPLLAQLLILLSA
jgi:hypothetical protein